MKAFPSQSKLPDLRNNVKNLRPGHRVAQWHIRLICRPNPGKQYLFNCLCLQVKTLVLLPLDGFYFTLSSIPNVESIKLGRKQKKRLKHLKVQASKITTGFVAILQKCVFFFPHQYFKCIYTTAIPSIMPIRKVWKKFSYFPCKRAWQHDSIQFCRRPRCMHGEWIRLAVCIFSPHSCFSTVLLTVLNENTAKVKTPKCGGVERHIYSHMWRVRPLQLHVASHSFELQVLPLPGKDRWCIIPLQPITHSVSLTRSLCSPSARSTVAQILRTNESAEAYGFNLFTAC